MVKRVNQNAGTDTKENKAYKTEKL